MRQVNEIAIPSQSAATVSSAAIPALNLFAASAQITSVGAGAAGTLKMQASNDDPLAPNQPTNWSDISGASVAVSGAGSFLIPKLDLCYQWVRLVYTNSGSGTIQVVFKAIGA
jgi:hypothetical protein